MLFAVHLLSYAWFTIVTNAQSPHVYHKHSKQPLFDVQVRSVIIDGVTVLGSVNSSQNTDLLVKRQSKEPTPQEQEGRRPPGFPMPSCFTCPSQKDFQASDAGEKLLAFYTTDRFESITRAVPADLVDTCVFYTKAINQPPLTLSQIATQLACKYDKYTIWHLWANEINEKDDNDLIDVYGIFKKGNRLHPISELPNNGKPPFIEYFENMSRAMANMCSGQIYLLTQTPSNMQQYKKDVVPGNPHYPNIWVTTEHPALMRRIGLLTPNLILIDGADTSGNKPRAWKANWKTLFIEPPGDPIPWRRGNNHTRGIPADWEPYDLDSELKVGPMTKKRAELCRSSGVSAEQYGGGIDFFG